MKSSMFHAVYILVVIAALLGVGTNSESAADRVPHFDLAGSFDLVELGDRSISISEYYETPGGPGLSLAYLHDRCKDPFIVDLAQYGFSSDLWTRKPEGAFVHAPNLDLAASETGLYLAYQDETGSILIESLLQKDVVD